MSRPTTIYCPECGVSCGKYYPSTGPSWSSGGEEGYFEGKGEDYTLDDKWYCSQECLDAARKKDGRDENEVEDG